MMIDMLVKVLTFVALILLSSGFNHLSLKVGALKRKRSQSTPNTEAFQLIASKRGRAIQCASINNADDLYRSIFGKLEPPTMKKSILHMEHRTSPLKYRAVNLNISSALTNVLKILPLPADDVYKGPVMIVRGTGGGKTFAMVHLWQELQDIATNHSLLPILITFNTRWDIDKDCWDFYGDLCGNVAMDMFDVAVVVRIASVYYDIPMEEAMTLMSTVAAADFRAAFPRNTGHNQIIAQFLMYLARKEEKTKIVLMVDETVRAVEYMAARYEDMRKFSAAELIREGMLGFNYAAHGMQGALVMSGLEGGVAGKSESKVIYPFVLCEELNATAVTENMFLTQVDSSDREYTIVPRLRQSVCADAVKSERLARDVLIYIARVFSNLPRCLEFAQSALHSRVEVIEGVRTIIVTPDMVDDVYREVMSIFPKRYTGGKVLPEPDLLYALLFRERTPLDQRVTQNIRQSVFVNSFTTPAEFPFVDSKMLPKITPRSSIVTLNRGAGSNIAPVAGYIRRAFECVMEWPRTIAENSIGRTLENLAARWMPLLLSAASGAGYRSISVRELLQLSASCGNDNDNVSCVLDARITLRRDGIVYRYTMRHSSCDEEDGGAAMFQELNSVVLDSQYPCRVILSAPGDCWDYALGFLGEPDDSGVRPVHLVLFDVKATRVLGSKKKVSPQGTDPVDALIAAQARYNCAYPDASAQRGLGSTLARNEAVLVYQTTDPGETYTDETKRVVVIGADDTKNYFGAVHNMFAAIRASTDGN